MSRSKHETRETEVGRQPIKDDNASMASEGFYDMDTTLPHHPL